MEVEREPDPPMSVRLDADFKRLLDAHAAWLSNRRKRKASRSDVIRVAIAALPAPLDPHPLAEAVRKARSRVEDFR